MQSGSSELLLYESQEEDTLTAREGEAYMIAEQIRALVGREQIEDVKTGQMHTLSYRDIVILVRGGASAIEQLQAVLTEEGIPVHVHRKQGIFPRWRSVCSWIFCGCATIHMRIFRSAVWQLLFSWDLRKMNWQ